MDPNTQDPQAQPEQQPIAGGQQPPVQPQMQQPVDQLPTEQPVVEPTYPPTGSPQQSPVSQPLAQPAQQTPIDVAPKKSKKGLIIAVVITVAVLLMGVVGAGAYIVLSSAKKASDTTATKSKSGDTDVSNNNSITAKSESDFSIVCEGGTVKNAAQAAAPYKITTFYNNEIRDNWTQQSLGYGESYYPDYEKPAEIGVVACLDAKRGSETKATVCEFTSDGEALSLDYYSLQYQLTYYSAATGKKLGVNDSVAAPATACPFSAFIKDGESRLFADPDDATVEELHKSFIASK